MNLNLQWEGVGVVSLVIGAAAYYVSQSVREAILELRIKLSEDLAEAKAEAQKWVEERFVAKS